jgi:hypothetical protein
MNVYDNNDSPQSRILAEVSGESHGVGDHGNDDLTQRNIANKADISTTSSIPQDGEEATVDASQVGYGRPSDRKLSRFGPSPCKEIMRKGRKALCFSTKLGKGMKFLHIYLSTLGTLVW